jgi:hypothetical protein
MIILEILKYTLPSVVVFLTAYFIFKEQTKKEVAFKKLDHEKKSFEKNQEVLLPVRLQAYERLLLFLQRIHPNQLVIRNSKNQQNVMQFQATLIKSVRDEFEHNMSQQLYVGENAWIKVLNAKEECLKQINIASSELNSEAKASELGSKLIHRFDNIKPDPIQEAIRQLKQDLKKGF